MRGACHSPTQPPKDLAPGSLALGIARWDSELGTSSSTLGTPSTQPPRSLRPLKPSSRKDARKPLLSRIRDIRAGGLDHSAGAISHSLRAGALAIGDTGHARGGRHP
jgi:hypothetical protein